MRTPNLHYVILAAGCIFSLPAVAGVGATNSGVTTTIPQDPTQPSADVQSQSSGFVQQNQQLANQQNQAQRGQGGIVLPGGTVQGGTQSGTASAGNSANPNSAEAGKNATPQTPPPPPAPPPVYQSVTKPVVRDTSASGDESVGTLLATTAAPTSAVRPPPVSATPHPVQDPVAARQAAPARSAQQHASEPSTKAAPIPPANVGGRGSAPDGYAFLLGLLATGALLAFALVTYLRIGRSGSNDS